MQRGTSITQCIPVIPKLARHPNVLTSQACLLQAILDAASDVLFVTVRSSTIDVPVACLDRIAYGSGGIVPFRAQIPSAKAQAWDINGRR